MAYEQESRSPWVGLAILVGVALVGVLVWYLGSLPTRNLVCDKDKAREWMLECMKYSESTACEYRAEKLFCRKEETK